MSAYIKGRPSSLFSLPTSSNPSAVDQFEDSGEASESGSNGRVFDQLEGFILATRQLENSLQKERAQTKKLKQDLSEAHATYDQLLKEAESKNRELTVQESKYKASFTQFNENEKKILGKAQALVVELRNIRAELNHYKAAWADVLQREREAKLILAESEKSSRKLSETEALKKSLEENLSTEREKRIQAERHAKTYQTELQSALVRIHSAEAKFTELSKEFQTHNLSKKNIEEEISKIEKSMRERFQWEALKQREKTKAELEKLHALEIDRFQKQSRELYESELQSRLIQEKEKATRVQNRLEQEVIELRTALSQSQSAAQKAREELNVAKKDYTERFSSLEQDADIQRSAVIAQFEAKIKTLQSDAEIKINAIEKDWSSKLLQAETECQTLKNELGSLRHKLTQQEERNQGLKQDLTQIPKLETQVQRLKAEVESAKVEQIAEAKKVNDLSAALSSERNRIYLLESELSRLDQDLKEKEVRLTHARAELPLLERKQNEDLKHLHERVRILQDALKDSQRKMDAIVVRERRKSADILADARFNRWKKRFGLDRWTDVNAHKSFGELTKNDYELLLVERENFEEAFKAESACTRSLEESLIAEKRRFDDLAAHLEAELERVRNVNPLQDLLAEKERELELFETRKKQLPKNDPRMKDAIDASSILIPQVETLRRRVQDSEDRMTSLSKRIRRATEINTLLSGPPEADPVFTFEQDLAVYHNRPLSEC